MKKIISIIAALSLVTTVFASFAQAAADVTFTAAGNKPSYAVGTYAFVKMTITSPNGFAGFKTTLSYDNNTFDIDKVTKSTDLDGTLVTDTNTPGKVVNAFGSAENLMPKKMVDDEETGETVEKDCVYTITYKFLVKDGSYNGDYKFIIESDPENLRNDANQVLTGDTTGATATIKVTGGKDVVAVDYTALNAAIAAYEAKNEADYIAETWAVAKAAYDTAKAIDQATETDQDKVNAAATALNDAITGLQLKPVVENKVEVVNQKVDSKPVGDGYTFGISADVNVSGSASFSKMIFNLKDGDKVGKPVEWNIGTSIDAATTSFGLNITGCPSTANITIVNIIAE